MIYMLVRKVYDDAWTQEFNVRYIFQGVVNVPNAEQFAAAKREMERVLDVTMPSDRIIYNGPPWLVAIAGYLWMTRECAENSDTIIYSTATRRGEILEYPL